MAKKVTQVDRAYVLEHIDDDNIYTMHKGATSLATKNIRNLTVKELLSGFSSGDVFMVISEEETDEDS